MLDKRREFAEQRKAVQAGLVQLSMERQHALAKQVRTWVAGGPLGAIHWFFWAQLGLRGPGAHEASPSCLIPEHAGREHVRRPPLLELTPCSAPAHCPHAKRRRRTWRLRRSR